MEYADYIGINLEEDKDLFYLAKEGLKAPLPADWKPCQNREGKIYYFNFKTKQSQWEHPCDEHYKRLYQELRKKKSQKGIEQPLPSKTTSKALAVPPITKAPLSKHDPLPSLKMNPISNKSNQQSSDNSFSVDNLASYALNHRNSALSNIQDMSSFTEKKSDEKSQPVEFENFFTLGSESAINDDYEPLEIEDEEDVDKHQRLKDEEMDGLRSLHKEKENKLEKELQQKTKEDLQIFKKELSANAQKGARGTLIREKEDIRDRKKAEFKRKTDDEIRRLDREYNSKKKDIEISQNTNLKDDRKAVEEELKQEHEAKRAVKYWPNNVVLFIQIGSPGREEEARS